ncbi:hypothetical protein HMPREF1219_01815 [Corynebacterium pyruviciproducens ATCC BAA-1742]|uniref:Histidine kinase/HSP90-like ATPase domain-containing protein n=1 Tax=Corynebacterium pyruviciproducens ATCC BAA-1742 TaxID=1125779 RepID=S2YWC8_9CORY|nr:ATP-binding protein [Corynebacterium pyruviciproducens]EPD68631.1 hypothetical protein HMPREF1219_01815 [Corynebacterium pyruviciproducens ATCC BAA-1742]
MSSLEISSEIDQVIALPPTEAIHHSIGANHDLVTGLDELIDNAIDAGATKVVLHFHVDGFRLVQIGIHDDGVGMSKEQMQDILRLGGHQSRNEQNIGRYGMGMKEGSFSNANVMTIVSRQRGQHSSGYQLKKHTFNAGVLNERSAMDVWNLRAGMLTPKHGTSIIWNRLTSVYCGDDEEQGILFISDTVEKVRRHIGIRYHRFIERGELQLPMFTRWDDTDWVQNPEVKPINPVGYRKSPRKDYPRVLTVEGQPDAPGITAHIWNNRSTLDEFILEGKDPMGHQGFYFYDADRLLTSGGWSGFRRTSKNTKLLRIVVDDPRVIDDFVTVSPQKRSVLLNEGFHRFIDSLVAIDDPDLTFEGVCADARDVLRRSNQKSGNADPISEAGTGIAPQIKRVIEEQANLRFTDPVDIKYKRLRGDEFVEIDQPNHCIFINSKYRKLLNPGRGAGNDAPIVKTLLYLLFNDTAIQKRTKKSNANVEVWSALLTAAAKAELEQRGKN